MLNSAAGQPRNCQGHKQAWGLGLERLRLAQARLCGAQRQSRLPGPAPPVQASLLLVYCELLCQEARQVPPRHLQGLGAWEPCRAQV